MSKLETITIDTPSGSNTMQIGSTNTATINLGVSGDTVNIPAGVTFANAGTATGFPAGLSDADYWYFGNNQTISAMTETTISGHWIRLTSYGGAGGELGSGLTESSGVFSFPSTGIYYVNAWFRLLRDGDSRYNNLALQVTLNNSSYDTLSFGSAFIKQVSGGSSTAQVNTQALIDVTDTSNVKFRFQLTPRHEVTINGAAYSMSGLVAIKLGDT